MTWFARQPLALGLWLILGGFLWRPDSVLCQTLVPAWPLLSTMSPDYRATSNEFTADQLVEFAEHLMNQGEYFRAVSEYRRFLFFYPNDPRCPRIHFRIGLAFYHGQRYEDASRTFTDVSEQYPTTFYGQQAWLWRGESLIQQGYATAAEQLYTELSQHFPDTLIKQQALYQKGWALLYRRRWQEASSDFRRLPPTSTLYTNAQQLAGEALKGTNLPLKSPLVAGILSGLFPGAGQLYIGRTGDALLAFFLNGLFIAGILQATQQNAQVVTGILSVVEAGWYTGNIYGAVSGAHKNNRYITENFLRNLENQFRRPIPESQHSSSLGLGFSLGF